MKRWILIVIMFMVPLVALATDVRTTVKYISASTVYLNAGRLKGIAAGDTVEIYHGANLLTQLTVIFIADNSASCNLSEETPAISVGDSARVRATGISEPAGVTEDRPELREAKVETASERKREEPERKVNRLSGRIGAEYLVQDDRDEFNYDYTQPSLNILAKLSDIQGSHYSASLRMRMRETIRNRETSSTQKSETSHRVYEAELRYENPDSPFEYGLGRMIAQELRGIGYLDGAYAKYKLSGRVAAGLFSGTEPDLENTDFQTDVTKGGIYASYGHRGSNNGRIMATLALAGTYEGGQIDREFVYQQVNYYFGSRLSLYESTEINVYRDWLKDKEHHSLDLASALINARYSPVRMISLSLGYDNRKSFYTYDARSVPDSLFDDALRQGWRSSVEFRFTRTLTTEVGGTYRTTEGKSDNATSSWLRANLADVLHSGVNMAALIRTYSSEFSDGVQPSVTVSKSLFRLLNASAQAGTNNYTLSSTDRKINRNWLRLTLDLTLGRHFYTSLDGETSRGSNQNSNFLSASLGYRL